MTLIEFVVTAFILGVFGAVGGTIVGSVGGWSLLGCAAVGVVVGLSLGALLLFVAIARADAREG